MKTICYKSKAIQTIIVILAMGILLSLWPFRLWSEIVTSSIEPATGTMSEAIDNDRTLLQSFVAQYDHLDTLRVYLGEETTGESFYCRILDEQYQMICEEKAVIDRYALPGYVEILMDIDMEVGKMYYCILQGDDSQVFVGCEMIPMTDMPYAGTMYYMDSAQDGMNMVADYNYIVPLRKGKVLLLGLLTALIAVALVACVRLYYKKKGNDELITAEKAFRWVMNPIVVVALAVCLTAVGFQVFSIYLLDNVVIFISILLLGLILLYGINHNRDGQKAIVTREYLTTHWPDLLQSFFIAGAIGACCEYMSGLYDIHHSVAERKEMIFFALAIIAMFKWREILNWYNAVYVIAAGAYGIYYYRTNLTPEMDEFAVQVLKLTVWTAILLGFIVIRTIIALIKGKVSRPSIWYGGLVAVFFAMIIIFRNGRWWTVALVVAFTLFYLAYGAWEHKERFLTNLCRGIILQFLMNMTYCLLHRPFVTYRTARYGMFCHTVTITAAYLAVVECAALVIFLRKFAQSHKWKDLWKEALLLGVVSSYLVFTMARTGYFAVGITAVFAIILLVSGRGMEKLRAMLLAVGMMLCSLVICLPATFFMQKTIPIIASDPYVYEIESYPDDIMRGRKLNSVEFMRVGRFVDVFGEKILGLPEGTFDLYGEIAAYNKENGIDQSKTELPVWEEGLDESFDVLVASAAYVPKFAAKAEEGENDRDIERIEDYTNGRIEIYTAYLEQLNMTGHEEMGATMPDGSLATHAHDIYLQVAYDHGIPVGILFLLLGIATFIKGMLYNKKQQDKEAYAAFPVVLLVAVAIAGIVEWLFHLSNPCGLVLMLVLTPLIFDHKAKKA